MRGSQPCKPAGRCASGTLILCSNNAGDFTDPNWMVWFPPGRVDASMLRISLMTSQRDSTRDFGGVCDLAGRRSNPARASSPVAAQATPTMRFSRSVLESRRRVHRQHSVGEPGPLVAVAFCTDDALLDGDKGDHHGKR